MADIESSIKIMNDLKAIPAYYDMGDRYGNDADRDGRIEYDCSSAVSKALGLSLTNTTESLKTALPSIGYNLIHDAVDGTFDAKRGDVVIWGPRDGSGSWGAFGHVMIMTDANSMIHCNSGNDGVTIDNYNLWWIYNDKPRESVYRLSGSPDNTVNESKPAQPSGKNKVYQVDDLQYVNGIWQVRCNDLVPVEFNWTDNGIACADITLTDKNGNTLANQTTQKGSYFIIEESSISSIGKGAYGSGSYYWIPVQFKTGGRVWLSAWDMQHLIKG